MHRLTVTIVSELEEPNRERISSLLRTVALRVSGTARDINGGELAAPDLSGSWELTIYDMASPSPADSADRHIGRVALIKEATIERDEKGRRRLPLMGSTGKLDMTIPVATTLIDRCDAEVPPAVAEAIVRTTMAAMGADYDSLDREALFTRAAARFGLDYDLLYRAWLQGTWGADG